MLKFDCNILSEYGHRCWCLVEKRKEKILPNHDEAMLKGYLICMNGSKALLGYKLILLTTFITSVG